MFVNQVMSLTQHSKDASNIHQTQSVPFSVILMDFSVAVILDTSQLRKRLVVSAQQDSIGLVVNALPTRYVIQITSGTLNQALADQSSPNVEPMRNGTVSNACVSTFMTE